MKTFSRSQRMVLKIIKCITGLNSIGYKLHFLKYWLHLSRTNKVLKVTRVEWCTSGQ